MSVGRPKKFKTPEQLQKKVDAYFKKMDKEGRPYLVTGLALHLDCTRTTLIEYEGKIRGREKGEEFANIIKKAKAKCEHWLYENALMKKASHTMAIFSLKANYNWKDWNQEPYHPYTQEERQIDPETLERIKETIKRNGLTWRE